MNNYGNILKQQIIESVKSNKNAFNNIIALIRCIYNEFNIRFNYDYSWLYQKDFNMSDNFDRPISFATLTCNKIICNEWCQLFKELLLDFGVSEKIVSIKSEKNIHKWIEIKLNNSFLILDGTTNYHGFQDMFNCKINGNTTGFIIIHDGLGLSLELRYKNGLLSDSEIMKQGLLFRNIDKILLFYGNPIYKNIKEKCESFVDDKQIFINIFHLLFNYNNEYALNGSDLSRFLKRVLRESKVNVDFLAFFLNDYIETCCEISYDNQTMFYSENTKLLFNKNYNDFKANIQYVKRIK